MLLESAHNRALPYELLRQVACETGRSAPDLLDTLSRFVASEYFAGRMSFERADTIMNTLWTICVSLDFCEDYDIPEVTTMVYLAFDAGEYHRQDDPPGTDPELKYTKPLIAELLAEHG
jgi:hypothetical protein